MGSETRPRREPKTPREFSGLPSPKFSDRECAAYHWLWFRDVAPWSVDLATKRVSDHRRTTSVEWPGLIEYARHHGWKG